MAGEIFISYRREDSAGTTGRLYDRLSRAFPPHKIFMDVDAQMHGLDFVKVLDEKVAACDMQLAIIGPGWLTQTDKDGRRRLDNPEDFVRIELASALRRQIPVIPVLVDGATMPPAEALPDDLKALVRRGAMELRNTRFNVDSDVIVSTIKRRFSGQPIVLGGVARRWIGAVAAVAVLVASGVGFYLFTSGRTADRMAGEARLAVEIEARRKAEAAAKQLADAETARRADEAAAAKKRAEDEARRKAEVAAKQLADAEAARTAERIAAEAKLAAEVEARRKAEAMTKRLVEADAARKADEAAAARKRAEDEARRKAEAEAKRLADEAAAAKRRAEDEARRKADVEAKRLADAEAARKADEAAAAKRRAEDEARKKAEAEAKRLADAEAARRAEQDRQKTAAEAKRRADEEAARRDPLAALTRGSGRSARDSLAIGQPCAFCPDMVMVPEGRFTMGSSPAEIAALATEFPQEKDGWRSEGPQRNVTFVRPFAVGRFAVTFDEWDACVADGGCNGHKPGDRGWGRGNRPVINVNWDDAKAYVAWLSRKTGKTYRLLSEAEREYVARAGTTTTFWWGNSISTQQANYDGNFSYAGSAKGEHRQRTVPVDSLAANPWGLHQVHGNVWEWTEDCWHATYAGAPTDGTAWTTGCSTGNRRVVRGGSWDDDPQLLRAADRHSMTTDFRDHIVGFRVARTLNP